MLTCSRSTFGCGVDFEVDGLHCSIEHENCGTMNHEPMLLYLELTRTFAGHEKWDYDFIMHQLYPTCVYVLYVPSLIYINKILFTSTKKMHIWIGVATGGIYIYISNLQPLCSFSLLLLRRLIYGHRSVAGVTRDYSECTWEVQKNVAVSISISVKNTNPNRANCFAQSK